MPIHVPFGAPVRSLGIRISLQVYTERSIWKFSYTQLTQSAATRNMSSCRSITRAWEAPPPFFARLTLIALSGTYRYLTTEGNTPWHAYRQGFTVGHGILGMYYIGYPGTRRSTLIWQGLRCCSKRWCAGGFWAEYRRKL